MPELFRVNEWTLRSQTTGGNYKQLLARSSDRPDDQTSVKDLLAPLVLSVMGVTVNYKSIAELMRSATASGSTFFNSRKYCSYL